MKVLKRLTAVLAAGVLVLGMGQVLPEEMVSVSAADMDWRQIYKEKMYEYLKSSEYAEGHGFGIFDLDRDQVPELFISNRTDPFNGPHYARCKIYTVSDGEFLELGSDGCYGWLNVIEGTNYLYSACNQGHSYVRILQKNGDTIETIFEAYTAETGQILGHDAADYIVNGAAASKAVYDTELAEYYDVDNDRMVVSNVGQQYSIDEATIMKIFETTYNFNNNTYQVFDISCSWTEAKEICENLGGNLVSINTAEEQAFIENLLEEQSKDNYWTGGYRSGNSWRWCDGTAVTYTNWDSWTGSDGTIYAQPDNYTGDEDYIRIASQFIQYNDWLVNAGGWIDTANTADGISSGEAGLHKFGFICEWEAPPDSFVQAHLNFIEENPDAFVNTEDVYTLNQTTKLMRDYDLSVTDYLSMKKVQDMFAGEVELDKSNVEMTVQALVGELLCNEEMVARLDTAAQQAIEDANNQILKKMQQYSDYFGLTDDMIEEVDQLVSTADKSATVYKESRAKFLSKYLSSTKMEKLSKGLGLLSDGTKFLSIGVDILNETAASSEELYQFWLACVAYEAADDSLQDAFKILVDYVQKEAENYAGGTDDYSQRITLIAKELSFYYNSMTNTSEDKYERYANYLGGQVVTSTAVKIATTMVVDLVESVVASLCPELLLIGIVFDVTMSVWEQFTMVDERALERDMYLNMVVILDSVSDALNDKTNGYAGNLLKNKDLHSAYVYEEGVGFYKRITKLSVDHAKQYYAMLYEDINNGDWWNSSDMDILFLSAGLLGESYTDQITGITGTIEQAKRLMSGAVDEQEEEILIDALTLAPGEFKEVQDDLKKEILQITSIDLSKVVTAANCISCHQEYSEPIVFTESEIIVVLCPVNLTIKNGSTIVAEVTKDVLTMYDKTTPVSVNLIKEEGDIYASKFVVVPSGYDVEITGYADGTMRFEKAVVENGLLSTISTITDIPVQNGSVYTEVIENNVTVALTCDLDGDGVTDETLSAAVTENVLDPGDLNSDGEVNASDAAMILVAAAAVGTGADSGLAAVQEDAADIDHDGAFNAVDAASVLQYAAYIGTGGTLTLTEFLTA